MPDRSGQRQYALGDADGDSLPGTASVLLQVKLTFEGVVDGLDELAHLLQQRLARSCGLVLARGPQQGDALYGQ